MIVAIIMSLRHLLGWAVSAFSSRENLILENLASSANPRVARQTASPSTEGPAQAVLGSLVRMGRAPRLGCAQNRCRLASGWLPVVLDLGCKSQTSGRTKTGE